MTEPEIARRCQSCGASIRDLAFFCPQCGKALKTAGDETAPEPAKPTKPVATAPLKEAPQKLEQMPARPEAAQLAGKPKREDPKPPAPAASSGVTRPQGAPGDPAASESQGKVHRAASLARNVGGDVVQRGQKLREMSSVVWDEASYDPSLRFVLVAIVLFVLFLVVVLLNRFIV